MKYLFFIQGEGRGHMTQALALQEKLLARGHEIVAAVLGVQPGREIPSFLKEQLRAPITAIESPSFVTDRRRQGVSLTASFTRSLVRLPYYLKSLKTIRRLMAVAKPDVIVNFYEPLVGIYQRLTKTPGPMFSVGHQFFLEHPAFASRVKNLDYAIKFYNWLVAPRQTTRIALSFTAEADQPADQLIVCPPLIRQAIAGLTPTTGNFILVYILNPGYSAEIIAWSKRRPDIKIEAFWDKPGAAETIISPSLTFHRLDTEKFRARLAACRAYASTAGFDSIAEAAYLQKEILVIPTKGHIEQKYNALDEERAGLALASDKFNLSLLATQKSALSRQASQRFREWADKYEQKIITLLENPSTPKA